MKFLSIRAQNYRQYEDLNLELVDGKQEFLVLEAESGHGKTTLFNALIWCLYGKEQGNYPSPIVNELVIAKSPAGITANVEVSIRLELDDESIAVVSRSQEFIRDGNTGAPKGKSTLKVLHTRDKKVGADLIRDPDSWIQKNLPERLYPYVIFNGEKSADYFDTSAQTQVRDAVLGIARVDVLQRMKSHLENVRQDIMKDLRTEDPEALTHAESTVSRREDELREIERSISRLSTSLSDFDIQHQGLKEKVARSADLRAAVGRREEAENSVTELERELQTSQEGLANWAGKNAPFFLGRSALEKLHEAIQLSKSAGTFPPDFQFHALEKLLHDGTCICGRELGDSDNAKTHIQALIDEFKLAGPRGSVLQTLETHLTIFNSQTSDAWSSYESAILVQESIREDLETARSALQKAKSAVPEGNDMGELGVWDALTALLESRRDTERELVRNEELVRQAKESLLAARTEFERAASRSTTSKKLASEYTFLDKAITKIDSVYNEIVDDIRDLVGGALNSYYRQINTKDNPEEIVLTPKFGVYKINSVGAKTPFSPGESRMLYYAFCLALREVSGFHFPVLIDSPWGNVSKGARNEIAGLLAKNVIGDFQLVLLVLDSEYTKEIDAILSVHKPRMFKVTLRSSKESKRAYLEKVVD
jgi:DNA sulfur modification protein DndD